MKVLHVYRTYFPDTQGGGEEVIRQICLNSKSLGAECRVISICANPDPSVITLEEAEVYRFKRTFAVASTDVSVDLLKHYASLLSWADIVHFHFPWPFADLLQLLHRTNKPAIVTYHSDVVRQKPLMLLYRPLMRSLLNRVDRIVATSPGYAESSVELQRYRDKLEVIPIGLNEANYPAPDQVLLDKVEAQLGGAGFFFFVGVLRYYKGLQFLLNAVEDTGLRCVIAGTGPEEKNLHRIAREKGLDNVQFVGRITDAEKAAMYQLCRAVVFPSHLRSEAFGVTLVEGSMAGKPLISAEIATGTSYVNIDGETGIVVPPADSKALREAMVKLAQNRSLAEELGSAARERYQSQFTGEKMGGAYVALYQQLLH